MLILIASWAAILIPAVLVGQRLLPQQVEGKIFPGDRWVIAVWMGLLALAVGLMGIALILPLRPVLVGSFLVVSTLIAASSAATRQRIREDLRHLKSGHLLVASALLLVMAWTCSREVTLFDTGLYHAQMLKLQREFGTIPGGALLHHRFGYNSSWFSLGSVFPPQTLGGMAGWVSLLHLAGLWRRIRARRAETSDWFAAIAYSLVLPILLLDGGLLISPSPDTPAALVIVIMAWWGMIDPPNRSGRLLLALLAFSVKLSLLPVLVIGLIGGIGPIGRIGTIGRIGRIRPAGLIRLIGSRLQLRTNRPIGPIGPILPILTSYKSSGCPLYPSAMGCLPSLPWAMPPDEVNAIQQMTINYARDGGRNLPNYDFWTWFPRTFIDPYTGSLASAALLIVVSLVAIGLFLWEGQRQPRFWGRCGLPLVLAVTGLLYIFLTAPSLRFSIGYLAILPALLLAYWRKAAYPLMGVLPLALVLLVPYVELAVRPLRLGALLILVIGYGAILWRGGTGAYWIFHLVGISAILPSLITSQGAFIRPRPLQVPGKESLAVRPLPGGGSVYLTSYGPLANQCWDAPLPCTPESPSTNLRLLQPDAGARGGFQRGRP